VFFLIGMGLDAWLGTKPIFMIALTVFALVAQFVRIYVVYSSRMATLEARRAELSKGRQS
jgi:F0F1-type ATP synthase assembly protein I